MAAARCRYHWGRYRGIAQDMKRPLLTEYLLKNVFFDTCVYHLPGIELLTKVIPVDNILFASEMVGAVRGIDPKTGNYYDDTKRYVDPVEEPERRRPLQDLRRQRAPRLSAPRQPLDEARQVRQAVRRSFQGD